MFNIISSHPYNFTHFLFANLTKVYVCVCVWGGGPSLLPYSKDSCDLDLSIVFHNNYR